jgi:electron transfer flavoprotein beta subunit
MQVVVCVKHELDATGPIRIIEQSEKVNIKDLIPVANPADLTALALVRANLPKEAVTVTVVSVGPAAAEKSLRACLAAGADKAVRVWDDSLGEELTDAPKTALLLAKAAQYLEAGLVVCGSEGLCETSGYIGPAIAELLDAVQICRVDYLEIRREAGLLAHRKHNYGNREIVTCGLPAVITVDPGVSKPPTGSMRDSIRASKTPITLLDLAAIGAAPAEPGKDRDHVLYYIPPRPRTKKIKAAVASDGKPLTPKQKMQLLMGGGAAKQSSSLITGDPKTAAAELIRFLESERIL